MVTEFSLPEWALALTRPYLTAKLLGRRDEALRIALDEGLGAGLTPMDLGLRMIVPAQHEVGRLWQENRISVAQEHLATSISQLVLSHLYPHFPRSRARNGRAVVACVTGELHDLGARMGADFLEVHGFDVRFLGADVSNAALIAAIEAERPDLLGLSVTMSFHLGSLRETIRAVRTVAPTLPIAVGGGLLERMPGLADELGVQASGTSADELARACLRLLDRATDPSHTAQS